MILKKLYVTVFESIFGIMITGIIALNIIIHFEPKIGEKISNALFGATIIISIIRFYLRKKRIQREEAAERAEWMLEFKDGIQAITPDIPLKNEVLYLKLCNVSWQELRKVKGSEVYKTIDKGTLYLTDKKLIFVGNHATKNIPFDKIYDIDYYKKGVDIKRHTGKSVYFPLDKHNAFRAQFVLSHLNS